MGSILERVAESRREEEALAILVDLVAGTIAATDAEAAEAMYYCALPHWFSEETIAVMRGEQLPPSARSIAILASLEERLPFIEKHDSECRYNRDVRQVLLTEWRQGSPDKVAAYSSKLVTFLTQKIDQEQDDEKRQRLLAEKMYHLLTVSEDEGIKLFKQLFAKAEKEYGLSTCHSLLSLASEQREYISQEYRSLLEICDGRLRKPRIICFRKGAPCPVVIEDDPKLVFALMPTDTEGTGGISFDDVYKLGIQSTAASLGLHCERAKDMAQSKDVICTNICQGIRKARCIVADVTGRDPNVLYELGLSHAFQKDVILIGHSLDVPEDLQLLFVIEYKGKITLLQEKLGNSLREIVGTS